MSERIDVAAVRSKLDELRGREYWRSLEEIARTPDFEEHLHREFRVPIDSGLDRRELLTLMGASMALAGLTGCTRQPDEKILPYVRTPEELAAGQPLFYATAHLQGGYARGILAETHYGRPTKIEGNELHPASLGGTDIFAQASILSLYDPDRSQTLTRLGEIRPFTALLAEVKLVLEKERPKKGAGLRILTPIDHLSDSRRAARAISRRRFPRRSGSPGSPARARTHRKAPAWPSARRSKRVTPSTRPTSSLSLDADFLGGGPAQPRSIRDFTSRRRDPSAFSRLYVVEPTPSLTGARADHRRPMRPAEIAAFARAVAGAVATALCAVQDEARRADRPLRDRRRHGPRGARRQQPRTGRRRPAARGARPGAPGQRDPRQRGKDGLLHGSGRRGGALRHTGPGGARQGHDGRLGFDARHSRRQPRLLGALGPPVRRGHGTGAPARSASGSTTTRPPRTATGTCRKPTRSKPGAMRALSTARSRSCSP